MPHRQADARESPCHLRTSHEQGGEEDSGNEIATTKVREGYRNLAIPAPSSVLVALQATRVQLSTCHVFLDASHFLFCRTLIRLLVFDAMESLPLAL